MEGIDTDARDLLVRQIATARAAAKEANFVADIVPTLVLAQVLNSIDAELATIRDLIEEPASPGWDEDSPLVKTLTKIADRVS